MPLDPDAERLLRMVGAAGLPTLSRLTPAEMRQTISGLSQILDVKHVPIAHVDERRLPGPAGEVAVRIYTPEGHAASSGRGLVDFHGGCLVFCDLDTHDGLCRMLAAGSGCRLVSVDYRLAPEHRFPAALEDAYAAAKWVAQHADELAIDPRRLAVAGDSAGANLASVVSRLARESGDFDVALQVLFCPALELQIDTPSRQAFGTGYFLEETTLAWAFEHACGPHLDLGDTRLFPLRAANFLGMPPTQIHTAEFDPLRDEGRIYAERLRADGVPTTYTCHPGMIYHFYCMAGAIRCARPVVKQAAADIRTALA